MLQHGVPWQQALGSAMMLLISFALAVGLSLISGWFAWYSIFTAMFLLAGFLIIIAMIPLMLNLSRSFFWFVLSLLVIHVLVTLFAFAFHYRHTGLQTANDPFTPSLYDALYFSAATFTTLTYGDIQPLPDHRLTAAAMEGLAGLVSIAVGASLIWLWTQENLVPKEMAFFDGNRRHKKSLSVARMRIRTVTGKERQLKDWVLPPKAGEAYHYDTAREEWVLVSEDTVLPENTLVVTPASKNEAKQATKQ